MKTQSIVALYGVALALVTGIANAATTYWPNSIALTTKTVGSYTYGAQKHCAFKSFDPANVFIESYTAFMYAPSWGISKSSWVQATAKITAITAGNSNWSIPRWTKDLDSGKSYNTYFQSFFNKGVTLKDPDTRSLDYRIESTHTVYNGYASSQTTLALDPSYCLQGNR